MDPAPERAMSTAMKMEQTGSAIIQPNICMRMADTMTPTLPRVSARMCRNTPCTQHTGYKEEFWVVNQCVEKISIAMLCYGLVASG